MKCLFCQTALVQHFQYLPYGESWIDQRASNWSSLYTFSGKEKDAETGYGYFGARYYSSDLSIWLSVDSMSDKYPSLSAYNYCMNNPIKLVDPNGEASNIKQARQYAKATGGVLKTWKASDGRVASVATKNSEGVDIRAFNPTNDSWGQKIGKFFNSMASKITGGQYGTADNGQGQETRKGDGSNKQVDVSQFTSDMPEPFNNSPGNLNTGEKVQENKEGTSGTIYFKDEKPNRWSSSWSEKTYEGTEDSMQKVKEIGKIKDKQIIFKVKINE